jgi:hypothetical protein
MRGSPSPRWPAIPRPPLPAAGQVTVTPLKRGPGACGQHPAPPPGNGDRQITRSDGGGLIRLTVNEIRRLHATFCRPAHPAAHYLRWSAWRRRHQARARHCHYQRRRSRL